MGNNHGVRPVGGGLGLFSCACMCSLPDVGGGCGCVTGLGIKVFGEQTHCRVHVQHRVSVRHCVVVALAASLDRLWFGCGLCVVGCL